MSQNGAGGLYLGNGIPTALGHGINPQDTFDDWFSVTIMPVNEFREMLLSIERQIGALRQDIKDEDEKTEKRIDLLRDIILGTGQMPGIDGRLRSVEADRDAGKAHRAMVVGSMVTLAIGVSIALIPIGWELIKYLAK